MNKAASNPVVKTIHFADHGQDFLSWGLDRRGYVRVCEPFQGFVWCGRKVLNADSIKRGERAELTGGIVNYPVTKVTTP